MKQLTTYINEAFKIKGNSKMFSLQPETPEELRAIVIRRYKESEDTHTLDLSDIDVSKLKTLEYSAGAKNTYGLFYDNPNLNMFHFKELYTINISGWDTSNVKSMKELFYGLSTLENIIGLEDLDVSNVTDLSSAFAHCLSLTKLDLSNWHPAENVDVYHLFWNCESLTEVGDIDSWKINNKYRIDVFQHTKVDDDKRPKWAEPPYYI